MNDLVVSISNLLIAIGFVMILLIMTVLIITSLSVSSIYQRNYKVALINIISSNFTKKDSELKESIKSEYTNYRNRKINAFSYFNIEALNSKLISELRNEKYKKYYRSQKIKNNDIANKLERINKLIIEEQTFEEDIVQIIDNLQSLYVKEHEENKRNNLVEDIKIKFSSCVMFYNGRIYEKDIKINDLENKLKKYKTGKIINWIGWIIGVISGFVTIYSFLK